MDPIFSELKADPKFRELSIQDQIEVTIPIIINKLQNDPEFNALNPLDQKDVTTDFAIDLATLGDTDTDRDSEVKQGLRDYLKGKGLISILGGPALAVSQAITASGVGTVLGDLISTIGGPRLADEYKRERRMLDLYIAGKAMKGQAQSEFVIGNLLGMALDSLAVSKVMAPLTTPAKISIAAKAAKASTALGTAAMKFFGPIAAETAIEAIPFYLLDEYRRVSIGQPSIMSQGAAAIAANVGENAAADFVFGSLLSAGAKIAGRAAKQIFLTTRTFDKTLSKADYDKLENSFITGALDDATFSKLDPYTQDRLYQTRVIISGAKNVQALSPSEARLFKASLAANDVGKVVSKIDNKYRVWDTDTKNNLRLREYSDITDLEDYIAFDAYKGFNNLTPEELAIKLRPDNSWLYARGKLLHGLQQMFSSPELKPIDPSTKAMKVPQMSKRPIITAIESDALASIAPRSVRANINLESPQIQSNISKGERNIFKGTGPVIVTPEPTGNSIFVLNNPATPEAYEAASKISESMASTDATININSTRAGILLDQGFDYYEFPDGRIEVLAPRFGKIIAYPGTEQAIPKISLRPSITPMLGRAVVAHIPELNITQTFEDISEARKFISKSSISINTLGKATRAKNIGFSIESGQYRLDGAFGTRLFTSADEVKKFISSMPDPATSASNLLDDIDPSIERDFSAFVKDANKRYRIPGGPNPYNQPPEIEMAPQRKSLSAWMTFRQLTSNFSSWIEDASRRTRDPELLRRVTFLQDQRRIAEVNISSGLKVIDDIFKGPDGKIISIESRRRIFYNMGADTPESTARLKEIFKEQYGSELSELTPSELDIAGKLKALFDDLGTAYGIRYDKLIAQYMPRIRNWADKHPGRASELLDGKELAYEVFGADTVPKEIRFFAENTRTDELIHYALKDDAYEVLTQYITQGTKKLYLNQAWVKLDDYLRNPDIDQVVRDRINVWREQIMGAYHTLGDREAEQFGRKLFTALHLAPEKGAQLINSLLNIGYFATMGYRPMLAIRGALQPLKTMAPRLGLSWALEGLNVLSKEGPDYFDSLRRMGVISDKPPIINAVFSHGTLLGRLSENSLRWFKNADDYARGWTYAASTARFKSALSKLNIGAAKSKQSFFELSGLDVIEPTLADDIWNMVGRKEFDKAISTFGIKWVEDTQFPQRAAESPLLYKGLFGKMLGQYGTYSAAYRANIANMFKYGKLTKKIAMLASYAGISLAIDSTFRAARINTNDFVPFQPALFSGGPGFDAAVDVLKSMDVDLKKFVSSGFTDLGGGYEARQARARLAPILASKNKPIADVAINLAPVQIKYIKKAIEFASNGDTYAAIMSLLSASVRPLSY